MTINESNQRKSIVVVIAAIMSVLVIALILSTFATAIIAALIAAFIFWPVKQWFFKKTKSNSKATGLTILFSFLVVFIPVVLIVLLSIKQIEQMIVDLTRLLNGIDGNPLTGEALLGRGNDFLSSLTDGRVQVNAVEVQETVLNAVKSIAELFLNFLTSSVGGIGSTVTSIIIFMYVYSSLLSGGDKLVAYMKKLNPLGDEVSDLYIRQAGLMTKSMVVVQIVVAMVQGLIGAVSLKLAGIDYFIFFAVILSVLSIIPLGGGILTIPIGIITILTGNIFGGVIILLVHFVVVTNIDNLLKAKLLSKNSSMHPALVMISILSGITLFGFMGIIIGPVLMILALTTLDVYKRTAKRRI